MKVITAPSVWEKLCLPSSWLAGGCGRGPLGSYSRVMGVGSSGVGGATCQ